MQKLKKFLSSFFPSHCWLLLGIQHKKLFPVLLSKVWHWPLDILRVRVWRLLWCVRWRILLWQVYPSHNFLPYLLIILASDLWATSGSTPGSGSCLSALCWPRPWPWARCTSLPRGLSVRSTQLTILFELLGTIVVSLRYLKLLKCDFTLLTGCLIAYYFLAETWFAVLFTVIVEIVPPEIRWLFIEEFWQ